MSDGPGAPLPLTHNMAEKPAGPKPGNSSDPGDARPHLKLIALLAAGHLVVDTNQGAIPAILPFLKSALNLSYASAGALVLVANLTSSIIQPLFGYFADQRSWRWMLPLSVVLAGLGLGLTGVAASYWLVMLLLVVMGGGVAAYHPEGYRMAAGVAGLKKATALSWFSVGGNIGIALGPPMITFLVVHFGMGGSVGMLLPALAMAFLLILASPRLSIAGPRYHPVTGTGQAAQNRPGAMALLIVLVAVRSWTQLGFATYVPFYYLDYLHASPQTVAWMLFVFLGAGAVGTLIGGPVADRWGAKPFTAWAFLVAAPLGIAFMKTEGFWAYVVMGLFGAALVATFTTTVVLGQAYLPRNPGMASGLIVGFAIGAGGVAVTLLGWFADLYGVPAVLWVSAAMPLIGFITAAMLPPPQK
ncbi:MAG: MFS transporter [Acidobacteriota bacterium]